MKDLLLTCLVTLAVVSPGSAQDAPFADKLLPSLFDKRVQSELELTDEQKTKLKDFLDGIKKTQQEYGQQLRQAQKAGASKTELAEKKEELIGKLEVEKGEVQQKAFDVLLPHQVKRLKQVTIQVWMRESAKTGKKVSGFLTQEMIDFLEIGTEQELKIKKKSEELRAKLMKDIQRLQEKYRKELMSELTAKQRKKFEEAIGDTFNR